jgi:hypothetical protein
MELALAALGFFALCFLGVLLVCLFLFGFWFLLTNSAEWIYNLLYGRFKLNITYMFAEVLGATLVLSFVTSTVMTIGVVLTYLAEKG